MANVTIGGNRLGAGNKNKVWMREYERSTHDLSYVWRSTMAAGTLVPFMSELALPGDTFDIDLNCDILTHPTIGPLFGTYKVQLDVFQVPVRLYQAKLHMNLLGIGMDMSNVALPQMKIEAPILNPLATLDNQQINPSCIFSYLGVRGVGFRSYEAVGYRNFNAIPYLGYWDIYKNYYANKQEEIGAVIHKDTTPPSFEFTTVNIVVATPPIYGLTVELEEPPSPFTFENTSMNSGTMMVLLSGDPLDNIDVTKIMVGVDRGAGDEVISVTELFGNITVNYGSNTVVCESPFNTGITLGFAFVWYDTTDFNVNADSPPSIVTFPLENIDTVRKEILQHATDLPYMVDVTTQAPFGLAFTKTEIEDGPTLFAQTYSQEGLGLKTYNSDLFNNWISTEWIDGVDGVSAVTAIDTSEGSFTIDELNLSKKIYDMLNRIALSGGSYDDWLDAVYTHDRPRSAENPMYLGGLIRNLVFQEVVGMAASEDQPLGTLAGRGKMGSKDKGGKIVAKVDEPSYLIGIISLTPNIDYSQGNKWDMNLKTMNDLHKPALDEIGFQDLITDQMAWFDTLIDASGVPTFKSAGKQPAWINYMTNVNKVYGNFADQSQQMFMVLNRRYNQEMAATTNVPSIGDLTTYIDPSKFNHIFADTRLDAQNFWAQVGVNIEARRKMSAKVIPNL